MAVRRSWTTNPSESLTSLNFQRIFKTKFNFESLLRMPLSLRKLCRFPPLRLLPRCLRLLYHHRQCQRLRFSHHRQRRHLQLFLRQKFQRLRLLYRRQR